MHLVNHKNKLLDLLYPPYAYCLSCKDKRLLDTLDHLCPSCRGDLAKAFQPAIPLTFAHIKGVVIPFYYGGVSKALVHQLKYQHIKLAALPLSQAMAKALQPQAPFIDALLPVPLHPKRQRQRGFNQAQVLGAYISQSTQVPLLEDALLRSKNTRQQAKLNKAQRQKNVANAFMVERPDQIEGKNLLIIDDVLTTGATLTACAKLLKQKGAANLYIMAAAYAPLEKRE